MWHRVVTTVLVVAGMVCRVGGGVVVRSVDTECHTCHHSPPTSQHTFTRHTRSYFYMLINIENIYIQNTDWAKFYIILRA